MNGTKPIVAIGNAYNAGKDPCECQASVRAQTFTDWECICVDDGSTDAPPAILDEYAAKEYHFPPERRVSACP